MKEAHGTISSRQLTGYLVTTGDGETVGEILGLDVDLDRWTVKSVEVRLRRTVITRLGLHRPLLGSRSVHVPTEILGENLELLCPLEDLVRRARAINDTDGQVPSVASTAPAPAEAQEEPAGEAQGPAAAEGA